MRTAGVAYQFRHRELQDFLARRADVPAAGVPALSSDGEGTSSRHVPSEAGRRAAGREGAAG
jgi:hypothetical protein